MYYCGVGVAGREDEQLLVVLEEVGGPKGQELHATYYEAGTPAALVGVVERLGGEVVAAVDAPQTDSPRACEELMRDRGLPAHPAPPEGERRIEPFRLRLEHGHLLFDLLSQLGPYRPMARQDVTSGEVGSGALARGRLIETCPEAVFCTLTGGLPAGPETPWGLQTRIAALKLKGVVDPDADLWQRSPGELDTTAAAYTAYAFAVGLACWIGLPEESVIVLPGARLLGRYDRLAPPRRARM